jgi:precorrin-3B methylase
MSHLWCCCISCGAGLAAVSQVLQARKKRKAILINVVPEMGDVLGQSVYVLGPLQLKAHACVISSSERLQPEEILLRLAAVIPQGVAGVFAVLYLLGAVAFGVALLFYTFSR